MRVIKQSTAHRLSENKRMMTWRKLLGIILNRNNVSDRAPVLPVNRPDLGLFPGVIPDTAQSLAMVGELIPAPLSIKDLSGNPIENQRFRSCPFFATVSIDHTDHAVPQLPTPN